MATEPRRLKKRSIKVKEMSSKNSNFTKQELQHLSYQKCSTTVTFISGYSVSFLM